MHRVRKSCLLGLLPLLAFHAAAEVSGTWMDFDGTIEGSSTDPRHRGWIDLSGFEISGTLAVGQFGAFSIRKPLDRASNVIALKCAEGELLPKATLDMDRAYSETSENRLIRLELEDVRISSYQLSGSSGADRPEENVGLLFRKITFIYILPDSSSEISDIDYFTTVIPSDLDTDRDGMPDAWEAVNGLMIGTDDSGGDLDHDGLTNRQEYELGTNPRSGNSFFKATLAPDTATPGFYQLSWNSVAGKTYVIEWTPDLATPFVTLRTVTATAASTTENIADAATKGFFRVRPQ